MVASLAVTPSSEPATVGKSGTGPLPTTTPGLTQRREETRR
jgi:hypothetical protein